MRLYKDASQNAKENYFLLSEKSGSYETVQRRVGCITGFWREEITMRKGRYPKMDASHFRRDLELMA